MNLPSLPLQAALETKSPTFNSQTHFGFFHSFFQPFPVPTRQEEGKQRKRKNIGKKKEERSKADLAGVELPSSAFQPEWRKEPRRTHRATGPIAYFMLLCLFLEQSRARVVMIASAVLALSLPCLSSRFLPQTIVGLGSNDVCHPWVISYRYAQWPIFFDDS